MDYDAYDALLHHIYKQARPRRGIYFRIAIS